MTTMLIPDKYASLLDGLTDDVTQQAIDAAKERLHLLEVNIGLSEVQAKFIHDVVNEARTTGKLIFKYDYISYCSLCKKSGGYAKYKRDGRYHRKGQPDHSKPLTFRGVELKHSFISMKNHVSLGGCFECVDALTAPLKEALRDVKAELPAVFAGDVRYKRHDLKECTECNWTGHEGQLGKLRTIMGDGYYAGKCPQCGAENQLFTSPIKTVSGFHLEEIA